MEFEFDPEEAAANVAKHGVTFEEAGTVFDDPHATGFADPEHSSDEDRWHIIGFSRFGRLLFVVHTFREDSIRIISARHATPAEARIYRT